MKLKNDDEQTYFLFWFTEYKVSRFLKVFSTEGDMKNAAKTKEWMDNQLSINVLGGMPTILRLAMISLLM